MGRIAEGHSAKANSDLSGARGKILKVVGVDLVDVVTSTSDRHTGILMNDPQAGQLAMLQLEGIGEVLADGSAGSGGPIAPNDLIQADATGRAIKASANSVNVIGHSLDSCAIAGGFVRCVIRWGR